MQGRDLVRVYSEVGGRVHFLLGETVDPGTSPHSQWLRAGQGDGIRLVAPLNPSVVSLLRTPAAGEVKHHLEVRRNPGGSFLELLNAEAHATVSLWGSVTLLPCGLTVAARSPS